MVIDSHIHVGQFNELYFSPAYVSKLMADVGADYYAVSSTSMCEEDYIKVLDELQELIALDENKVLPIMWITPEGLEGNIAWFLESDIKWRCLKIHPFLHQGCWMPGGGLLEEVIDIARELKLPLLIHTGGEECCLAEKFEPAIADNSDICFILAHGRPLEQALRLSSEYDNVYVDSAFMPIEHMAVFAKNGLGNKLLWGTDMCIPRYFNQEQDLVKYYKHKLESLRNSCSQKQFEQIVFENSKRVFGIV